MWKLQSTIKKRRRFPKFKVDDADTLFIYDALTLTKVRRKKKIEGADVLVFHGVCIRYVYNYIYIEF